MPLRTLWSESLFGTGGSRLRKSARRPNVTDPPALGGPVTSWLEPPPAPQAATTISAAVIRIPSDRLRITPLSPSNPVAPGRRLAPAYTQLGRNAHVEVSHVTSCMPQLIIPT